MNPGLKTMPADAVRKTVNCRYRDYMSHMGQTERLWSSDFYADNMLVFGSNINTVRKIVNHSFDPLDRKKDFHAKPSGTT